jgi:hypothetical protein
VTERDDAIARLEDALVEGLAAWAETHWPAETAYAIGLIHTVGFPPLPAPAIGTAAERDEWLEDPDEYGVGLTIWNPAEYDTFDPDFADALPADVRDLAERLNEVWMKQADDERWHAFMAGVARRLAARDWGDRPRTEDFIAFATDAELSEQSELEAQLARSVPAAQLDALRRRGLTRVENDES